MIHGYIDGRVTNILVDTGSAVMLVWEDVWMDAKSRGAVQLEVPVSPENWNRAFNVLG